MPSVEKRLATVAMYIRSHVAERLTLETLASEAGLSSFHFHRIFRAAFGERAVYFADARRTRADEDAAFDALDPAEQHRDGHQLQHLVAADRSGWSWRMAWEVVRDASIMARCHALLHVVSNVSTAVAYINPDIEMVFCDP